jgi:hypothetical protein
MDSLEAISQFSIKQIPSPVALKVSHVAVAYNLGVLAIVYVLHPRNSPHNPQCSFNAH